jgi:serine protease Do
VVKAIRKGKEMSFTVTIGRLEDGEKIVMASDTKKPGDAPAVVTVLGMTLSSVTPELRDKYKIDEKVKGAVITEVAQGGAAAEKGLEPGDVVLEAGGKPVEGASDVANALDAAEKAGKSSVLVLAAKGGKAGETRFIALKIKK